MASLGQSSDYLANYEPEPGDRLVLGSSEFTSLVPIGADYFAIREFGKFIQPKDSVGIQEMIRKNRGDSVEAGAPILFIKKHEEYKDADLAEVRILEGRFKDKAVFTYLCFCKKIDPAKVLAREKADAEARAWAVAKANRKPLDPKTIVADLSAAIKKAKNDVAKLTPYKAAQQKEKVMREAIDVVRRKHIADLNELNTIATAAGVFVNFDGQRYDVAGNKIKR